MGNALIAHAQGQPTPAALYAYRQAMAADPKNSAAPFFLGMTLAQTGDYRQARDLLAGMLKKTHPMMPHGAGW
ncbi:tetratricopeptide repeat protein [Novosphingobium colocasiae]